MLILQGKRNCVVKQIKSTTNGRSPHSVLVQFQTFECCLENFVFTEVVLVIKSFKNAPTEDFGQIGIAKDLPHTPTWLMFSDRNKSCAIDMKGTYSVLTGGLPFEVLYWLYW